MFLISKSGLVTVTRHLRQRASSYPRSREMRPWALSGKRCVTTSSSGAYVEEPVSTPLGLLKVILTVLPGLYIGASISKTCAAFLEENDIFVPADDDDDDD